MYKTDIKQVVYDDQATDLRLLILQATTPRHDSDNTDLVSSHL